MLQKLVTRQLLSIFSPLVLVQCLGYDQYRVKMKSDGHSIFSCSLNRFTEKDTIIKYAWIIENVPQNVLDKLTTYANFPSLTASVTLEDLPYNLLFRKMSCNISWKKNETYSDWNTPISSNTLTEAIQCPKENAVIKMNGYATDITIKEDTKYIAENSLCKRELRQWCSVDIAVLFEEEEAKRKRRCSAEETVPIIMKKGNCTERHPLNALTNGINISIMSSLSPNITSLLDAVEHVKMSVTVYNSQEHIFLQKCFINITVQNEEHYSRLCTAYNDPHITTFDSHTFNFMETGLFLLYKREYEMFEVYIKLCDCTNKGEKMIGATCIGEVVVVSEDDFILFRVHGEDIQIFSPDAQISSKLEKHSDYWSFIVTFPTGTRVLVQRDNYLRQSVEIYSSGYDKSNTTGLCGNSNDILKDDENFSTPQESSLRWRNGGDRYLITEHVHKRSLHCSCLKGKRQFCGFGLQAYLCITKKVKDFTAIYMRRAVKPPIKWPVL
ncbi:uncharacterized protein LOC131954417 [Physella acuta]|uniref:uncharacterized protein LOC131954417 n=1 Tax=Physella acuta TaxID=109671 RepID=UPI0027DBC219|nr:uncharacterized protein LOC131954417 [Physella acuta]